MIADGQLGRGAQAAPFLLHWSLLLWAQLCPAFGSTLTAAPLAANITSWPALLEAKCCVTSFPAPGSNCGFMGPLRCASTARTRYGYYRFGNTTSGRPPLVLINGLASTMHDWAPSMLKELAAAQEVVIYDNPGEGFSLELDPPPLLTIPDMAQDALDLYAVLGLQAPNLLGLSMGGQIALTIAATAGERVGRVAVAPGDAGSRHSGMRGTPLFRSFLDGSVTFMSFVGAIFDLDSPEGLATACSYGLDKQGGLVDPPSRTGFARHVAAIADFLAGPGVWDALPGVNNPVLLIQGACDPLMPAQDARHLALRLRGSQLAVYPAAQHGVLMSETHSVLGKLAAFLEQPVQAGAACRTRPCFQ